MRVPLRPSFRLWICVLLACGAVGCANGEPIDEDTPSGPQGVDGGVFPGSGGSGGWPSADGGAPGDAAAPTTETNAFLHADVWSIWWNDRTRCGAERTFLDICTKRGGDCSTYQDAVAACDPSKIVYGQVGPEKQGETLCQRGKFPSIGGCDATKYDFGALRFYWYGAEWQGNWPWATIKVFAQGQDYTGGGELVAISSLPGKAQAAMGGISNHTLGHGCAMAGTTSGDDKYLRPFGGFAWVELPADKPLSVAVAAGTNFADNAFQGCNRGSKTQDPWVTGAPGAVLGCVYVTENVVLEPGKHYFWQYGKLTELAPPAPPQVVVDGFALPEVAVDVTQKQSCAL